MRYMEEMESHRFSVSGRAAARIAELAGAVPQAPVLRVAVLAGGCSGFQYRFELDATAEADDVVISEGSARV
ncbi:MAG: HesB/IscA family protein, partial [Streptosporangiaceae bacterium]